MTVPRVEVLLSTYNPDPAFLGALLESLGAQTHPNVTVSVRDDGSTPGVAAMLSRALADRTMIRARMGERLGPGESFMRLLADVEDTSDFAAFCDQDDVWFESKIADAVAALIPFDSEPAMYCSRVQVTDRALHPTRLSRLPSRGPSFTNALVQNIAIGASIVLNRRALDLLATGYPKVFMMHDAWTYLVVAGCGRVVYDPRPQLYYRQHSDNAIGLYDSRWEEIRHRLERQLRSGAERKLSGQAEELRRLLYDDLRPDARAALDRFLDHREGVADRFRYVLGSGVRRQTRTEDWVIRGLYMLCRI